MKGAKTDKLNGYLLRDRVLKLLSDAEIAQVSTLGASAGLLSGDQFINLEELERGATYAVGGERPGRVLAKKSVHEDTWAKILKELAS